MVTNNEVDALINLEYDRLTMPKSYYSFFKAAWKIVEPQQPLVDNWHVRFICWRLQQEVERIVRKEKRKRHLIINIPPRSGKSYLCTVMLNAWAWTFAPHLRFITSSYSDTLSSGHSIKTKVIIESAWYRERWGNVYRLSKKENQSDNFANTASGRRIATSVNGSATGLGANIIIPDDLIDPRRGESTAEREKANTHLTQTLYSRLDNPEIDVIIMVMQRLHEDDPVGRSIKDSPDEWEVISIPSEDKYPVKPKGLSQFYIDGLLDPVRFSRETLRKSEKVMGSRGYAGQHGQQPSPPEGNILKRPWFRRMKRAKFEEEVLKPGGVMRFCADTAYDKESKVRKNDPSGALAYCVHNNTLYITRSGIWYEEIIEMMHALENFCRANGYRDNSIIKVEPEASGKSIVQVIRRYTSINVKEGTFPKDSKFLRVSNIAPFVESGRVILVEDGDEEWIETFLQQVCTYPNVAHDELADCLVMAVEDVQKKAARPPRAKS